MPWTLILAVAATACAATYLFKLCVGLSVGPSAVAEGPACAGRSERRSLLRTKMRCQANLVPVNGPKPSMKARLINISDYGALVGVGLPLEVGSDTLITIPSLSLTGAARVRHCKRKAFHYAIGLEFKGPLRRAEKGEWTISTQSR
jgi:hypothetical protein